ncbi:MAG: hypothetical protein V3U76_19335 [Granulosicoccus sp.]
MLDTNDNRARQLTILGVLLQILHPLFGITAVMGMLVTHMKIEDSKGTIYHSQLRWQLVTFWTGLAAWAMAFWWWLSSENIWPIIAVAGYLVYRIGTSLWHLVSRNPIRRII